LFATAARLGITYIGEDADHLLAAHLAAGLGTHFGLVLGRAGDEGHSMAETCVDLDRSRSRGSASRVAAELALA